VPSGRHEAVPLYNAQIELYESLANTMANEAYQEIKSSLRQSAQETLSYRINKEYSAMNV
jgi:hypothetical protein